MSAFSLLDQFNYHHRLAETPGAALVLFTAPTCGACKRLRQMLLASRLEMSLFEVDVARDAALAREFDLLHLPALFLYRDGCFHCEIAVHESSRPEHLRELLADALRGPAGEAP